MSNAVRNVTYMGGFIACSECGNEIKMKSTRIYTDNLFSGLSVTIEGLCSCRSFAVNNLLCADLLRTIVTDSNKFKDAK